MTKNAFEMITSIDLQGVMGGLGKHPNPRVSKSGHMTSGACLESARAEARNNGMIVDGRRLGDGSIDAKMVSPQGNTGNGGGMTWKPNGECKYWVQ